jgi:gamma-glutamyltranspeptidase
MTIHCAIGSDGDHGSCYSDAFCLFYDAKARIVKALNGSGRAPEKLSIEYLRSLGITERIATTDLNSVTVPGSSDAAAHKYAWTFLV